MTYRFQWAAYTIILIVALCALPGCVGRKQPRGYAIRTGGDAKRGAQVITHYRCGACHMIPGIRDAPRAGWSAAHDVWKAHVYRGRGAEHAGKPGSMDPIAAIN